VIDPNAWVLGEKLPQLPANQIVGPMVRLTDFDPVTGTYALSMLVVAHPSLTNSTVQMHYAVNAPATQSAPSQILDEYMGYRFYRWVSLQQDMVLCCCCWCCVHQGASKLPGSYASSEEPWSAPVGRAQC
jgi:hypothetical protein